LVGASPGRPMGSPLHVGPEGQQGPQPFDYAPLDCARGRPFDAAPLDGAQGRQGKQGKRCALPYFANTALLKLRSAEQRAT
jgi:hypothetical protein